jgi:short-subunit dehydrogenase
MDFKAKYGPWALIIGASEGLGAAFADECAQRGLNVAIAARRQSALDIVAQGLRDRHGVETRTILADAGAADFEDIIRKGVAGLEVGFMIFNAAAEPGGPFLKIKMEDHLNNIQVNCVAPTRLVYWLGAEMVERKRGGVVLVSSMGAITGLANWASYSAAKSYELLLGESLWDEFRDHGVLATSYLVGSTFTPTMQRIQHKLNSPFAKSIDPADYPEGTPLPRTPESVAAALFPQLEDGPRLYCHPDEEAMFKASAAADRAEWISKMGESTKTFFNGGLNELKG